MHFALPPRKTSHPPPYARSARSSTARRKQLQIGALLVCAALIVFYLVIKSFSSPSNRVPPGTPEVVIVTVLDSDMTKDYTEKIEENRGYYATKHGYKVLFPNATDYDIGASPKSWSIIPAVRHAMTLYPHTSYFFLLSPQALIMNPSLSLINHIMDPKRLESLMLKDRAVVPPDSVIHTFSHLKGDRIDLVITQDGEGLCQDSFIIRRGEWAKFFLDSWFDPLYRSYNFQKAEGHALVYSILVSRDFIFYLQFLQEHIVQWHPTILTKLALIPQRLLNAYGLDIESRGGVEVMYKDHDFIVNLVGCAKDPIRSCAQEMESYYRQWKTAIGKDN
ncbi:hypothetical protein MMC06_000652 [Schaereria dolodes]|nr:hypothetical protein [Schaereria dolodes]